MIPKTIRFAGAAMAACLLFAPAAPAAADEFSALQRNEIEQIVRDYIISHPEVLQDAMAELEKRQQAAEAEKAKTAIKDNAKEIFSSSRQVTIGNPQGDVTLVEFFDYNCGYCKRALSDMLGIMKGDGKLKVVLKEFPVLGPGSTEAAQVGSQCACKTPPEKNILNSIRSCSEGADRLTKRARLPPPKTLGLMWRGLRRIW